MTSPLLWQRRVRRWHRGIALITSVQLLLWTVSGVYFAFVDIEFVRGNQFKTVPEPVEFSSSLCVESSLGDAGDAVATQTQRADSRHS
jgi:hypothetical protein